MRAVEWGTLIPYQNGKWSEINVKGQVIYLYEWSFNAGLDPCNSTAISQVLNKQCFVLCSYLKQFKIIIKYIDYVALHLAEQIKQTVGGTSQ